MSRRQWGLWFKLCKYNYTVKHVPGKSHPADKLSRRSDYSTEEPLEEKPYLNLSSTDLNDLTAPLLNLSTTTIPETLRTRYQAALRQDEDLKDITGMDEPLITHIDLWPEGWTQEDEIYLFNEKIYVPTSLRSRVLELCHDVPLAGHFGQRRTVELVQRDYYWPGMTRYVKEYVRGCHSCRRNKSSIHKTYGLLAPHPHPEAPWTRVDLDFITGLPKTKNNHDAILVMIDAYIKRAHFEPV